MVWVNPTMAIDVDGNLFSDAFFLRIILPCLNLLSFVFYKFL
jgi:hypothetical protein